MVCSTVRTLRPGNGMKCSNWTQLPFSGINSNLEIPLTLRKFPLPCLEALDVSAFPSFPFSALSAHVARRPWPTQRLARSLTAEADSWSGGIGKGECGLESDSVNHGHLHEDLTYETFFVCVNLQGFGRNIKESRQGNLTKSMGWIVTVPLPIFSSPSLSGLACLESRPQQLLPSSLLFLPASLSSFPFSSLMGGLEGKGIGTGRKKFSWAGHVKYKHWQSTGIVGRFKSRSYTGNIQYFGRFLVYFVN